MPKKTTKTMDKTTKPQSINRRAVLTSSAAIGVGALLGAGAARQLSPTASKGSDLHGPERIDFYGKHQAGIATTPAAHISFVAFDLKPAINKQALLRLMRLLTDSAARLTQGEPALADTEPELARSPARLTVTFGFGPRFVHIADRKAPEWLKPLPAFSIDALQADWSDGDVLIQVSAEDPVAVTHCVRILSKDLRSFATLRWRQDGFRHAAQTLAADTTMRNLFGQVDGTVNPQPGTAEFDQTVWCTDGWWAGGTGLVLRRISMDLDAWDPVSRSGREEAIGRRLSNGAPLTGQREHDEPDLEAKDELGLEVIAPYAHIRRAKTADPSQVIFRRPYNYDVAPTDNSTSNTGLLFASFQADVTHQFVPIQRQLAELDMLNEWTTPIGSAVFVIPPGCMPGGFIGETLLS